MITFTVTGSLEDCKKDILDLVSLFETKVTPQAETVVEPVKVLPVVEAAPKVDEESVVVKAITSDDSVVVKANTSDDSVVVPNRRRRRSKLAKEATESKYDSFKESVGEPINIKSIREEIATKTPPMPTTDVHVEMPMIKETVPTGVLPTFQSPPVNTHTVQSFRDNLLPILNKLVIEGKIDTEWINNTKTTHFNNMDAIHWAKNEAASESLFNTFIQWGFING